MGGRGTGVAQRVLAAVGVIICVLLPAAPVAAHNSLTGSDPRHGARLAKAPQQVRLTFLSRLDPATTRVTVTGPDDADVAAGPPRFSGSRVTVPVRPGAAGVYIVRYEVASGDGHPVEGEVRFTLTTGAAATPTATTPSPTPTATASAAAPAAATSAPATAGPLTHTADEDRPLIWPWLLGGALAVAAVIGGLLLRRRSSAR